MKIINVEIEDARWAKLKVIADGERRHIKHQAALVLENWIDAQPPAVGSVTPGEELAATAKQQQEAV